MGYIMRIKNYFTGPMLAPIMNVPSAPPTVTATTSTTAVTPAQPGQPIKRILEKKKTKLMFYRNEIGCQNGKSSNCGS